MYHKIPDSVKQYVMRQENKTKPAATVCEEVEKKFGVSISDTTVSKLRNHGTTSPKPNAANAAAKAWETRRVAKSASNKNGHLSDTTRAELTRQLGVLELRAASIRIILEE